MSLEEDTTIELDTSLTNADPLAEPEPTPTDPIATTTSEEPVATTTPAESTNVLKEENDTLKAKIQEHESTIQQQNTTIQQHESTIQQQNTTIQQHESKIQEQKTTIETQQTLMNQHETTVSSKEQMVLNLNMEKEALKTENENLQKKIAELNAMIKSLEDKIPKEEEESKQELTIQERNQIRREKKNSLLNSMTNFS